ncbi:MAG: 50S ribosomal protein L27 [Planctomycetes bacterium]|nr:50S ribosomal protein L27 [Planctomycetota bacterium]
MAHKKGGGSSSNGRDSNPQHPGVKAYGGQWVGAGAIILRQRGTRFRPGRYARIARDDTIFATAAGLVRFAIGNRIHIDPLPETHARPAGTI